MAKQGLPGPTGSNQGQRGPNVATRCQTGQSGPNKAKQYQMRLMWTIHGQMRSNRVNLGQTVLNWENRAKWGQTGHRGAECVIIYPLPLIHYQFIIIKLSLVPYLI